MAEKTKHSDKGSGKVFAFLDKPDPLKFFEEQPLYEDLCREVEYILRKRLQKDDISFGVITSRAKSYKSFADKLSRSDYQSKPSNIRDRAGARLVHLYRSDFPKIEAAIRDEFAIVDKKDSTIDQEPGQFGYSDVKFYVKLKKQVGPRYDDLKGLVCEIQVRTVGQDAWALISRDLIYNRESQIPKKHQRALNRFVGLFELADEQFDSIRTSLLEEREKIAAKAEGKFLEQAINLDTLKVFLEKYIVPERAIRDWEINLSGNTVDNLHAYGYKTLKELNTAIGESVHIIQGLKLYAAKLDLDSEAYPASIMLEAAIANSNKKYLEQNPNEIFLRRFIRHAKEALKAS